MFTERNENRTSQKRPETILNHEQRVWAKQYGVKDKTLRDAVQKVGPRIKEIELEIFGS